MIASPWRRKADPDAMRPAAPILPSDSVANRALVAVIAIMTFVAALTVGTVGLVREAATQWRTDVTREVTIQVRPVEGHDQAAEIEKALQAARRTPGIAEARSLSSEETGRLLEPWLGTGIDLDALPLPRLVVLRFADDREPDLAALRRRLDEDVAGATLDDHRTWLARLAAISDTILVAGSTVLLLVLAATMLSVSFATRSAVATNRAIVEVLHFVGARDSFIARAFQRHFLTIGLKGGLLGGGAAALLFVVASVLPRLISAADHEADFLFGRFVLAGAGYLGIAGVVMLVALITALASRFTVRWTLREID